MKVTFENCEWDEVVRIRSIVQRLNNPNINIVLDTTIGRKYADVKRLQAPIKKRVYNSDGSISIITRDRTHQVKFMLVLEWKGFCEKSIFEQMSIFKEYDI